MIDLNGEDFAGSTLAIFNDGEVGIVRNVSIEVEKRGTDIPENYPDYKLIIKDNKGAIINQGFYCFTPNTQATPEHNKKRGDQEISRVVHLARAVMGSDYVLPTVENFREAYDAIFKIVQDNAGSKLFNVFTTYGTINRPNKKGYMGLRYFNFIEPAGETTRFRVGPQDLMSRIEADAPGTPSETVATTKTTWGGM